MRKNRNESIPYIIILLFSFLLYGNTLTYDYTLDDLMVITENSFTAKGLSGIGEIFSYDSFTGFFGKEKKLVAGGRYRPLSIATFAVEYAVVGKFSPFLSHLINILLYAITGMVIFLIVRKLVKPVNDHPWFLAMPFIATLLFIAHPVHTEVVANIKGRDEILALLFSLISLWLMMGYLEKHKPAYLLISMICLFLGLLSKENAVAFVAIIPLTLYFFTAAGIRKSLSIAAWLFLVAALFVFIRFLVLGYISGGKLPDELLNNPFLNASISQKFGTVFYTLGRYLQLLVFPLTLTHDYYPFQIPLISFADPRSLLPLLLYLFLVGYAVSAFPRKKWLSYAVWLYLLPLVIVSNLLFPVGTFMNERFIYFSSLGFVIAVAWFVDAGLPRWIKSKTRYYQFVSIGLLTILLLFSARTISRNRVWKDNYTLFTSDVLVSDNSIKCNVSAGGETMKMAEKEPDSVKKAQMYEVAFKYLEKAIKLYPKATNGHILYGNAMAMHHKDLKKAIDQYLIVLDYDPYELNAFNNALKVLNSVDNAKETDYKLGIYSKLFSINPEHSEVNYYLGKLNGQFKGNFDTSAYFLERTLRFAPDNVAAYKDLGIVYSLSGKYPEALSVFSRALKLAPDDQMLRQNYMITHQVMQTKQNK